ncbi:trimeric intracellular cation channel family protein [Glutamicibacter sp. PS]|uniref:trimeric intracellular cation channel family protein n=1 Tax=Glutamicibacter TaxID=1742989 RepID=UPI002841BAFD|nr:trimeric intracellular cation channel family protein [Glutamicibacter sp. PS]MDR4535013.1 trimeric intracellular cation channel family protein [Glutamicibacter sp. PS]
MMITMELVGIFFFAVAGSLMAARRGFDILGSVFLGGVCGLGGGVVRDLILNQAPATFQNPVYFTPAILAALCVYALTPSVQRLHRLILVFDAGGLALFSMTGTLKALDNGVNPVTAILLGVITAVGGGLLRDVISNVTPDLFNPGDIYAIPAILGAALSALAWHLEIFQPAVAIAIGSTTFLLRLCALRFNWRIPMAAGHWYRQQSPPPMGGPQRHF